MKILATPAKPGNERAGRTPDKRARILKAAAKTFARKGFYHTKIAEIARQAGIADGTIYLYFKSKDDILISLFEESMEGILQEFRRRLAECRDSAAKIRSFIHLHFELVRTNPDLAAVMQLELRQSNQFIKQYAGTRISDYLNLIGDIISEGQASGVFRRDIQPGVFKRALFGALDEMSTLWVLSRTKKYDLQEAAEQIGTLFLTGMLAPLPTEAGARAAAAPCGSGGETGRSNLAE
ncbi:MAG: TetR family transcriptional regulator [candidate division KSB1 bacterium]|nr:TetR family transcriptional regulator [candidate division KSB1 bacterium]MDZ7276525.1 TetR family transcriptional regulator [candidate division KSB1 bacterium]MDZ7286695.1 TetR family transcriptional regulator [candidate division KSB1 bacterium]MDZ7300294.1 TetR family transcriptional regulator [candidate division KSB1 bacterium]MDZ7309479.1 TetR family transcriptional regulator [candidate division KSB1 bacterium]